MPETYVNALVFDKKSLNIDADVRQSLKIFYQRNLYIDSVAGNPMQSIIEENEDRCLERADELGFDYLILTWEGNIFNIHRYHHEIIKAIDDLNEKLYGQWLVMGHVMDQYQNRILYNDSNADKWQNSFWLFPITAIVNLKKWRLLGKPKWGQQDGQQTVTKILPSSECIHDNYTPLSILPYGGDTVTAEVKKGWNIIDSSMKAGLSVHNLPTDVRNMQNYLYPENNIETFNNFWRAFHLMPKLTGQYKKVLESLLPSKNPLRINDSTWQCFIKNTEDYYPKDENTQGTMSWDGIDTMLLPSSGFKDFIISMGDRGPRRPVHIVHFDIIPQCVKIRQAIIEHWNGRRSTFENTLLAIGRQYKEDPISAFHMHSMKSLNEAYDHILENFDNEQDLEEQWLKFKSFKHDYIEADMLVDPYATLRLIKSRRIYICLSDIAGWRNNIVGYGYKNLRNNIINCIQEIKNKGITGIVDYKDPGTDLQLWQEFDTAIDFLRRDPD